MQRNSQNISPQEELAYEKVAAELAENIRKEGLWAKALSVCEGDEAKSKALYISYRAQQILNEIQPQSEQKQSSLLSSSHAVSQKTALYIVIGLHIFLSFFNATKVLIDGRYRVTSDGTVTDLQTNLIWQRCSVGRTWTGETCAGKASNFNWDEAMPLAKDGWRLPTVDELDTLVFCSSGQRKPSTRPNGQFVRKSSGDCQGDYARQTINHLAFPNTEVGWFWSSSSTSAKSSNLAWGVSFNSGHVGNIDRAYRNQVRLVRDR